MCNCLVNGSLTGDLSLLSADGLPEPVVICECPLPNGSLSSLSSNSSHNKLRKYIDNAKLKGTEVIIDSKNEDIEPFENEKDGPENEIEICTVVGDSNDACSALMDTSEVGSCLPNRGARSTTFIANSPSPFSESSAALGTLRRSISTTSVRSHWSIHTVYTYNDEYTDCDEETISVCSLSAEPSISSGLSVAGLNSVTSHHTSDSMGSALSSCATLRDLGPDTRSREEIFLKGIPWGLRGRDYLPPVSKEHHLLETVRSKSVKNRKSSGLSRFTSKMKDLIRKRML
jgi:hypothetical protein